MKDKKNIVIIILSILLVATVGYIVYSELNMKNNPNNNNPESNNTQNDNTNKNNENSQNQTTKYSEYNIVGEAYNGINVIKNPNDDINIAMGDPDEMVEKVILPKILKDTETTRSINKKILDDNKWAISAVENGLQNEDDQNILFDVTTNYDYTVHNNILYILVTTKNWYYHSHAFNTYYSYYYDIKNDKELSTSEVANKLNIKLKDIDSAKEITNIMYINNNKQAKIYYNETESNCSNEECKAETTIDLK